MLAGSKMADSCYATIQVYAVVVGALSSVTCVVYFVPFVMRVGSFIVAIWNTILFILWITLFGVFAKVRRRRRMGKLGGHVLTATAALLGREPRGRRRHQAHEERHVGGPDERAAVVHRGAGDRRLLVEAPRHEDALHGASTSLGAAPGA